MTKAAAGFDFGSTPEAPKATAGATETKVGSAADGGALVFNLTDTPEKIAFEVMPKGKYEAVVDDLTFGTSKAGDPMVTVKYAITTGEYAKRSITDYWVLAGNGGPFGQAKLKAFLVRVCPEVALSQFDVAAFAEAGTALGRPCILDLGIRTQSQGEYKGEKQNTIKEVLSAAKAFGL